MSLLYCVRKYEHPGATLSGAYCVEMLPRPQRSRAMYDKDIQCRVCNFLRHEISKTSRLTIWPGGFVNLEDLLSGIRKYTDPSDLSALFRTSYMHTQLDDGGVRFKIVYLASKKQWHLPVGSAPFQAVHSSRYCTDLKSAGEIKVGFYIRVEGGMSEYTHCRVIQDLYRTRYTPEHPKWQDTAIHGTSKDLAESIIESGLICGGVQRMSADKRAEVHLVNGLVGNGAKTAGVRKSSNAH